MDTATPDLSWTRLALLAPVVVLTGLMASGAWTWCPMDFANLAFHEFGHLAFAPFGSTMHYLGGSLFQLLVPAGLAVYFVVRQGQPLGAAFCVWWVGESLINVAIYMADARALALPLVGGGDHDWNELFFRFGLLAEPSVERVAGATHAAGVAAMLLGAAWIALLALPVARRLRLAEPLLARRPGASALFDL